MIENQNKKSYETAVSHYNNRRLDMAFGICEDLIKKGISISNPLFLAGMIYRDRGAIEKSLY